MKIYFAASIRGGREDKDLYLDIIKHLQNHGQVLTEHIGDIEHIPVADQNKTDQFIFERDMGWIKESDIVVAEVTQPSLGVGYELGWADGKKPILCLYREKEGKRLSAMLSGNRGMKIFKYEDLEEAKSMLDKYFKDKSNLLSPRNMWYINTFSDTQTITINEYDPQTEIITQELTKTIQENLGDSIDSIKYFGSAALYLPGENDIDIAIITHDIDKSVNYLNQTFGLNKKYFKNNNSHTYTYQFNYKGYEIDLFITNELNGMFEKNLKNSERLKENPEFFNEYKKFKEESKGLSKREYVRRKMLFFM